MVCFELIGWSRFVVPLPRYCIDAGTCALLRPPCFHRAPAHSCVSLLLSNPTALTISLTYALNSVHRFHSSLLPHTCHTAALPPAPAAHHHPQAAHLHHSPAVRSHVGARAAARSQQVAGQEGSRARAQPAAGAAGTSDAARPEASDAYGVPRTCLMRPCPD